ncbi:hypothetical protein ACFL0A_02285 [Patescibacteria group bacterium]
MKFQNLRKKYSKFIYENYFYKISNGNLEIFFRFKIEPDIVFNPKVIMYGIDEKRLSLIGDKVLNNLIFHLGLMEIPSYWKSTCSQEISIKAGSLNSKQIKWWKELIIKGMGQFFYENKIDFRKPNFLKIVSLKKGFEMEKCQRKIKNQILLAIGGGKDSIVSLEILKSNEKNIRCFSLNPTKTAKKVMKIGNCKNPVIVRRKIDKRLLELNRKGFLNGHTPFSAYLAFLSVLCAVIFDRKYVVLSNERSSNEGNVKYLGKTINHQYSKTFDFERKFKEYSKKYLAKNVEYFSFLRSLYEIQISKLFSKCSKYFLAFLSCNEAYKTNSGRKKPLGRWCTNCSKCLFVWISLYPFFKMRDLIEIFKENLFQKKNLISVMKQLIGKEKFKPFECVGTKKESLIAFYLSWKKSKEKFPKDNFPLLNFFEKNVLPSYPNLEKESKQMLNSWNDQHNLPKEFDKMLKNETK